MARLIVQFKQGHEFLAPDGSKYLQVAGDVEETVGAVKIKSPYGNVIIKQPDEKIDFIFEPIEGDNLETTPDHVYRLL